MIEFIDGKMVVYMGEAMPVKILTNNTYAESLRCWQNRSSPSDDPNHSLSRFVRAADMVSTYKPSRSKSIVDYAFDVLTTTAKDYRARTQTKWSIVYGQKNLRIHFRTAANGEIRFFNLNEFDFSCGAPVKVLDINGNNKGEVAGYFLDYSKKINRSLVCSGFKKTPFFRNIPETVLDEYSQYPASTHCSH